MITLKKLTCKKLVYALATLIAIYVAIRNNDNDPFTGWTRMTMAE